MWQLLPPENNLKIKELIFDYYFETQCIVNEESWKLRPTTESPANELVIIFKNLEHFSRNSFSFFTFFLYFTLIFHCLLSSALNISLLIFYLEKNTSYNLTRFLKVRYLITFRCRERGNVFKYVTNTFFPILTILWLHVTFKNSQSIDI